MLQKHKNAQGHLRNPGHAGHDSGLKADSILE